MAGPRPSAPSMLPDINQPSSGPVWRHQKRPGHGSKRAAKPRKEVQSAPYRPPADTNGTLPTAGEQRPESAKSCDHSVLPAAAAAVASELAATQAVVSNRARDKRKSNRRGGSKTTQGQVQLAEEWLSSLLETQWKQDNDEAEAGQQKVSLGISREALHEAGLSHAAIDR